MGICLFLVETKRIISPAFWQYKNILDVRKKALLRGFWEIWLLLEFFDFWILSKNSCQIRATFLPCLHIITAFDKKQHLFLDRV